MSILLILTSFSFVFWFNSFFLFYHVIMFLLICFSFLIWLAMLDFPAWALVVWWLVVELEFDLKGWCRNIKKKNESYWIFWGHVCEIGRVWIFIEWMGRIEGSIENENLIFGYEIFGFDLLFIFFEHLAWIC